MEKQKNGIGRRKAAVTRVFLSKGEGSITVNDKDYKVYFPLVYLQNQVERPFKTVDVFSQYLEPQVAQAAFDILNFAGYDVKVLPTVGAGASFLSKGFIDAWRTRRIPATRT